MWSFWTRPVRSDKTSGGHPLNRARPQVETLDTRILPAVVAYVAIPTDQFAPTALVRSAESLESPVIRGVESAQAPSSADAQSFSWGEWSWGEHTLQTVAR